MTLKVVPLTEFILRRFSFTREQNPVLYIEESPYLRENFQVSDNIVHSE